MEKKSYVVVSMTSIPSRIKRLTKVIRCILDGTVVPDQIILNIPNTDKYIIPHNLQKLIDTESIIILNRCDDKGPATKLLPTLSLVTDPDTFIVTVDDDVEYPKHFIEGLVENYIRTDFPCGYSGVFVDGGVREAEEHDTMVDVLEEYAGIIYKRSDFLEDFEVYCNEILFDKTLKKCPGIAFSNYLSYYGRGRVHIQLDGCNRNILENAAMYPSRQNINDPRRQTLLSGYQSLLELGINTFHYVKRHNIIYTAKQRDIEVDADQLILDESISTTDDYVAFINQLADIRNKLGSRDVVLYLNIKTFTKDVLQIVDFACKFMLPKQFTLYVQVPLNTEIPDDWIYDKERVKVADSFDGLEIPLSNTILVILSDKYFYHPFSMFEIVESVLDDQDSVYTTSSGTQNNVIDTHGITITNLDEKGMVCLIGENFKDLETKQKKVCLKRFANKYYIKRL